MSSNAVSGAIKQLWREAKFSSRDVVMGIGSSTTAVREIDVAFMPMHELRLSLPFQVQEMLPMPVDEAILDFFPGTQFDGPTGRMVRGLLVAATKRAVSANVDVAEQADLHPHVVDLNALALLRSAKVAERPESVVATVDIGGSMTTVAIAARGVPRLVRVIPTGGRDVTNAVARQLNMPVAEAEGLKRQIGASATDSTGVGACGRGDQRGQSLPRGVHSQYFRIPPVEQPRSGNREGGSYRRGCAVGWPSTAAVQLGADRRHVWRSTCGDDDWR